MLRTKNSKYTISNQEFKTRRDKVLTYIESSGLKAFVLSSGTEKNYSNDVYYPFRVDSNFYYLTGFTESEAVLVLEPGAENPVRLYIKQADENMIIWEGERATIESSKETYGFDAVYDIEDYDDSLEKNLESDNEEKILKFIHSLRAIKSNAELDIMRRSNEIAIQAHSMLDSLIEVGIYEYELEAHLNRAFRSQGASGWAYPAIVAAGKNSCILHYIKNDQIINKGDLVLSSEQQDIYDLVLGCQKQVIEKISEELPMKDLQDLAEKVIAEGLKQLGYIKDINNKDELKKYFMHGIGHSLGIDVHDPGLDRKKDLLMENMVITIEPGIYIADKAIGVRIEDNVVVKKNGYENLTEGLAK